MKVTTKAFHKSPDGFFYSRSCTEAEMCIDWLGELDIPFTATTLWFELSDIETEDSLAVNVRLCVDNIFLEVIDLDFNDASTLYEKEFIKGDFDRLKNILVDVLNAMYLRVYYR